MSAIYKNGIRYSGPTMDVGSDQLDTEAKTIISAINEVNDKVDDIPSWAKTATKPTYTATEVGAAPLNGSGKIDSEYLPSYVDDVLEYNSYGGFPLSGETGKIYVDLATNQIYRWSGSTYVEVSPGAVYESKAAVSGGTDVSLVTTGEKYTWNGKQDNPVSGTVTLVAGSWSNNTQTVNATGVTANSITFVTPNVSSIETYSSCGVLASAQGNGTLTFSCEYEPEEDIVVNVVTLVGGA